MWQASGGIDGLGRSHETRCIRFQGQSKKLVRARRVRGELRGQHTRSKGFGDFPCLIHQRQPLCWPMRPQFVPPHRAKPGRFEHDLACCARSCRQRHALAAEAATTHGATGNSHADLRLEDQQPIPKNGTGSAGQELLDRSLHASVNLGLHPTPGHSQSTSTGSPTCNQ